MQQDSGKPLKQICCGAINLPITIVMSGKLLHVHQMNQDDLSGLNVVVIFRSAGVLLRFGPFVSLLLSSLFGFRWGECREMVTL
jgi:hypothetical protein